MNIKPSMLLAALMLGSSLLCVANPSADVSVSHAWSRATPPGITTGVVYLTIVNRGDEDELLRVESPSAEHVEMHETLEHDGMMEMRPLETLRLPAGSTVKFEPSGKHMMLIGLRQPLREGESVPLTLVFRRAGRLPARAVVGGLGATEEPTPLHPGRPR